MSFFCQNLHFQLIFSVKYCKYQSVKALTKMSCLEVVVISSLKTYGLQV